jgi:D-xylose transport system substrate-binding protein
MHMRTTKWLAVLSAAALTFGVAACGGNDNNSNSGGGSTQSTSGGGGSGKKIAFLLPESKTARYESQDRPLFTAKVKQLCPNCEILYSNADQDAAKQQQQAEAAITQGANVLVFDPVDSASAAGIVNRAKQSNIPVISYDRLILNAPLDYYVAFNSNTVGVQQGTALSQKLKKDGTSGPIVMINGAPTDNNAKLFKQGAHSVFSKQGVKIAKEYDTPDWSPDKAQQEMEQAITALGKTGFTGVYAANDGTAGGAIAAMKSNGVDPKKFPTTGQDAELAGIQRIILGDQYMTVYKPIKPLADIAAQTAVDVANGKKPSSSTFNTTTDNGQGKIPTALTKTTPVTRDNVMGTVIKDGYWKASQVCAGQYAKACASLGIQ